MARFIRGPFGIGFVNADSVCAVSDVYFEPGPRFSEKIEGKQEGWDHACITVLFKEGHDQRYRKMICYSSKLPQDYSSDVLKPFEQDLKKFLSDLA